jgi:hypothetical protein
MKITVTLGDNVLAQFADKLEALGQQEARRAMSSALNHEGKKGFTQVKRVLVKQTGIKYGSINEAVKDKDSTAGSLTYTIIATGDETSLTLFNAVQRKKGVSATPWANRRIFKHTFLAGGRVYVRETAKRKPISMLFGPNIAREVVKDESAAAFKLGSSRIADAVAHEIARRLP